MKNNHTRRQFLKVSGGLAAGCMLSPYLASAEKAGDAGIQLYSVRENMLADAAGTLKQLAKMGYKELESARSDKGNYYGLHAKDVYKITEDLGMTMRSGHVGIDKNWQKSIEQAVQTKQTYLICSSMPAEGQTVDNYKRVADMFNKAGEDCKKAGLIFGYHNHDYEFEKVNGEPLYNILIEKTDPELVKMEMDIGWIIVTGNDPDWYFKKYPGRFPLWHLKDMNKKEKHSTEFGKGDLDIAGILKKKSQSGMKYYFVEQEEYSMKPLESLRYDIDFLRRLK
ncbi:MAG: TIM barrel protein [Sphingobacteriaceae bacterium]